MNPAAAIALRLLRRLAQPTEKILLPRGNVRIEVVRHGRIVQTIRADNLIPRTGRNVVAELLGNGGVAPSTVGVGTDNSQTLDTTCALGSEVFRGRITRRIFASSKMTFQYFLAEAEANGYTLAEVGVFAQEQWHGNDPIPTGGGYLFARTPHSPIEKDSSVSVTYTLEYPIASG